MNTPIAPLNVEELKAKIIAELGIENLPESEQLTIINDVSQMLLRRATFAIMRLLPPEVVDEVDRLTEAKDLKGVRALVLKHVPNVEEVAVQAARTALDEHKQLVAEQAA